MTQTRKFSQFVGPSPIQQGDIVVGLRNVNGKPVNFQFTGVGSGGSGGTGSGVTLIIQQPAHNLVPGDWVRVDSAGLYVKALADTPQNAEVAGCVLLSNWTVDQFSILVVGYCGDTTFSAYSPMPGQVWFLSDMTLGAMTLIKPTVDGEVDIPVFIATDTLGNGWVRQWRGLIVGGGIAQQSGGGGGGGGAQPDIVVVHQPGHGLSVGQAVRLSGPVNYVPAIVLADSQVVGIVIDVAGPADFTLQTSGYNVGAISQDDQGNPLVADGRVYYLSATLAGAIGAEPVGAGLFSKPLFVCEQDIGPVAAGYIYEQRPLAVDGGGGGGAVVPISKTVVQAGHGFTEIGTVVIPQMGAGNNGFYQKAQSNTLNNSFGVAMVSSIIDVNTYVIQEVGYLGGLNATPPVPFGAPNGALPLVFGVPYYLSSTTAGAITKDEPPAPNYSKPIFIPDETTSGWIVPMKPTLVGGGGGGGGGGALIQMLDFYNDTPTNIVYGNAALTPIPFLSQNITPSSLTSRIKITFMINAIIQYYTFFSITRNGVPIPTASSNYINIGGQLTGPGSIPLSFNYRNLFIMYVDRPNTTSAITYGLSVHGQVVPNSPIQMQFNLAGPTGYPSGYTTMTLEEYSA